MKLFKIVLISILGIVVVGAIGAYIYFNWTINQPKKVSQSTSIIEIKDGEGAITIAKKLKDEGIIQSDLLFIIWSRLKNRTLQAGVYKITSPASLVQVYNQISTGKVTHKKVTIPEGYRTEQIAQVLAKNSLADYNDFVAKARPYEGMLFPDTYFFPLNVTADTIITRMKNNYDTQIARLNLTRDDLIIASIVEREAINDAERPLIAGIYKNRLKINMKLEADPTVYYANDNDKISVLTTDRKLSYKFWSPIALSEYKKVDSPYNTYISNELPPGPICNPGLASIKGTINYQKHDYYYFLQSGGEIYPAKTEAEHNRNRAKVLGVRTGF